MAMCPDEQRLSELLAQLARAKALPPAPKGDRLNLTSVVIPSRPHVIGFDRGGVLTEYVERYETLKAQGNDVEVRGQCESACTLVTSVIPKARLCFGDNAALHFHKAHVQGNPSSYATQWMIDSYPAEIRNWIVAKGGAMQMPEHTFWTLPAPVLWSLGYRRCAM